MVKADGYGHGMVPVRAGRAGRRRDLARRRAPSTRRWRCARPGSTAPVLAWLHAPGPAAARGASRPTSTSAPPSLGQLDEIAAAAPARRRAGPACTSRSTPGCPAAARPRPTGRRCSRPRAKAAGRRPDVEVVGHLEPLRLRRRARPPDHRPPARRVRRGAGRGRAGCGVAPAAAAPGQLGGHADPARGPLRPGPARDRGLRPLAGRRRATFGLRPAMTAARPGRADQAGPGRRGRLLRPHLHHRRARPTLGPGAARVRRRGAPAAAQRRPGLVGGSADRSPAGSAWTSSCSTAATTRCAAGDEAVLFGPGDDGEPTARGLGRGASAPSTTRSSPGSAAPGCPRTYVASAG